MSKRVQVLTAVVAAVALVVGVTALLEAGTAYQRMGLGGGMSNMTGLNISGSNTDELIVNQTSTGDIVELRDAGSVVFRLADGGAATFVGAVDCDSTLNVDGATTLNGNVALGNATSDQVKLYGPLRTWDGNNWINIDGVTQFVTDTGRANLLHIAAQIDDWDTTTSFQTAFFNTQAATTTGSGLTVYGLESKATFSSATANAGKGIGVYGKISIKTAGTELAEAYAFYSIIDVNDSTVITTSANYYAELSGEATLGTVSVLKTKAADTWDYGIDFTGSIMTADFRGQNGETIDNATDTVIKINGKLGYLQYIVDKATNYAVTAAESGAVFTNDGASGTITFTLPTPADGLIYTFLLQDNYAVIIDPHASEVINYSGATGGEYITSTTQFDSITLFSDGTDWFVKAVVGTWADE